MTKSVKGFKIDTELWKEFKKYCVDKGTSISEELEKVIKGVLNG
jgi:hypothetical protein